jgi:X-X-X-Leu-X-X-Gly heptad repeat protein
MTERKDDVNSKLDEAAAKLDQGAARLDEGAGKIREGASALHQVAAPPTGAGDADYPGKSDSNEERDPREASFNALQVSRAQAMRLRQAAGNYGAYTIDMVKRHPLTTLTTLSAAAAFIEVELAVGLLAGIAGAAFLMDQPGAETRQALASRSRLALARARETWQTRRHAPAQVAAAEGPA